MSIARPAVGAGPVTRPGRILGAAVALVLLAGASAAQAGELDRARTQLGHEAALFRVADADLGTRARRDAVDARDVRTVRDLQLIEDFHPEVDRWTPRHNRIRLTVWQGAWVFSEDLDIQNDYVIGLRLAWEVPGFIGIRWDSGFVPWSRLEVKVATANNPRSSRHMDGFVSSHYLSLGIFNPELSVDGLAFWAGFGFGWWLFDYNENDLVLGVDADWNDSALAFALFVELDYAISDIFHLGIGVRQHFINADWTDDGRYYDLNGVNQSQGDGRNDGIMDDIAGVTEFTFNISLVF